MEITKALTVKQPWLFFILNHFKDMEIRTWNTKYRGYIALHASKSFDIQGYDYLKSIGKQMPLRSLFETGKILGTACLYDIKIFKDTHDFYLYSERHLNDPTWFNGRQKGFILQDIEKINPVEYNGSLGLFNIELEVTNGIATIKTDK